MLVVAAAGPAVAATVLAHAPCPSQAGVCIDFTGEGSIPDAHSAAFELPTPGKAIASLSGSMACQVNSGSWTNVDIDARIVTSATGVPTSQGASGTKFFHEFPPAAGFFRATTFNVAASRTLTLSSAG